MATPRYRFTCAACRTRQDRADPPPTVIFPPEGKPVKLCGPDCVLPFSEQWIAKNRPA